jgi:hypothetical protein
MMMRMNSFKLLEEEGMQHYQGPRQEKIESSLNSTLGTVRFLGRIVDVYLARMVDTIVEITGGDTSGRDPHDRRPPTEPVPDPGDGPRGPKIPTE